jgi:purine-binding chemotaxis protein CheW
MTGKLDEKMLSGFSRELRGYLTNVRESLERLHAQQDACEQAIQGLTTITGALEMIGFTGLSHLTSHLRETLEESLGNQSTLDAALRAWLESTIIQLERQLESILAGQLSEDTFVAEVERSRIHYTGEGDITELPVPETIDMPTAVQDMGTEAEDDMLYVDLDEDEHETIATAENAGPLECCDESHGQPTIVETAPVESAASAGPTDTLLDGLDEATLSATSDSTPDACFGKDDVAGQTDILPTDTVEFVLPENADEDSNDGFVQQQAPSSGTQEETDTFPDVEKSLAAEQYDYVGRGQEHTLLSDSSDLSADAPTSSEGKHGLESPQDRLHPTETVDAPVPEFASPDEPTRVDVALTCNASPSWNATQDQYGDSPEDVVNADTPETIFLESSPTASDKPKVADSFEVASEPDVLSDQAEETSEIFDTGFEIYGGETICSSDEILPNDVETPLPVEFAEDEELCTEPSLSALRPDESPAAYNESQTYEDETSVAPYEDMVIDQSTGMPGHSAVTPDPESDALTTAETGAAFDSDPEELSIFNELEDRGIDDDTPEFLSAPPEASAVEPFVVPLYGEEEVQNFPEAIDVNDMEPDTHTAAVAERTEVPNETEPLDLSLDMLMAESGDDDNESTSHPTSQGVAQASQESEERVVSIPVAGEEECDGQAIPDDSLPELLFDPAEDLDEEYPGEESSVETPTQIPGATTLEDDITATSQPSDTTEQELTVLIETIDNEVQNIYGQPQVASDGQRIQSKLRGSERYLLYTLAGSRYAVGVHHVLEISRVPQLTVVPNVPEWVSGVVNLRGEIISVIDLRTFLGLEKSPQLDQSRLLIVKTHDDTLTTSLIVDQINGFARLPESTIQNLTISFQRNLDPYIAGISDYENQVLAVFDLQRFLQSSEICQFDVT